jgi:hypothetical protein
MRGDRFSPEEFGAAYQRFLEWVAQGEGLERSPFKAMLTEHFGTDSALAWSGFSRWRRRTCSFRREPHAGR